jgi:hypothetical protein
MRLHTVTKSPLHETVRLLSSTKLRSVEAKQATTEMETTMNTRHTAIFGLAVLGLALAAPVQAAPDFMDDAFVVAQRDRGDEFRQDRRDARRDAQSEGDKQRASRRAAERDEPEGYGYGYERRHQQQGPEENGRFRGRR